MRIIHAEWEKRNLGVDCMEFEFDRSDDIDKVNEVIQCTDTEYQVAKVATGRVDVQSILQDNGFKYVETNIQFSMQYKDKRDAVLSKKFETMRPYIGVHDADEQEIEIILNEIQKGDIFTTDKVALDPYFSKEKAGRRYCLWTRDVIEKGAFVIVTTFREEPIGFAVYIDNGRYWDGFLGGLLGKYVGTGYGVLHAYALDRYLVDHKVECVRTGTSTNNPIAMSYLNKWKYKTDKITNIFVKHM